MAAKLPPVPEILKTPESFPLYRWLTELRNAWHTDGSGIDKTQINFAGVSISDLGSHKHSDLTDVLGAAAGVDVTQDRHISDYQYTILTTPPTNIGNTQLADMPAGTIKGNNTAAPAAPLDLSVSQALDIISNTELTLLVRGPSGWIAVTPPTTDGQVLTYDSGTTSLKWA